MGNIFKLTNQNFLVPEETNDNLYRLKCSRYFTIGATEKKIYNLELEMDPEIFYIFELDYFWIKEGLMVLGHNLNDFTCASKEILLYNSNSHSRNNGFFPDLERIEIKKEEILGLIHVG